jgi:2-dehydropantoate 2-reductase
MHNYIIQGAGAIGSAIGGSLAKMGYDVTLISRKTHINAISSQNGLYLHTLKGINLQPVKATDNIAHCKIDENTVIFQTMKAHDTQSALNDIKHINKNIPVICWQNGIENEAIVSKVFKRVYGGIVRFTGTMMTPGKVQFAGSGKLIVGLYPKGEDTFVSTIVTDLNSTGFTTLKSGNIMQDKWLKILVNLISCIKPITLKTENEPEKRIEICRNVLIEGIQVLKKSGITAASTNKTEDSPEKMVKNFSKSLSLADGEGQGMQLKNSTWQSLAKKKKNIESDFYTGLIIKLGKKNNVPTPYNKAILYFLHKIAENELGPESIEINEIIDMIQKYS